ncbi:c2h2 transcription factor [Grosmannia clavigera kw1407]|uniref:C2h2 transcription factor n=1 Tax=Grosmannia clavigera (strain kw1407 / UAMH 11150) TaxID=655863 RepID=F0XG05_GROCL|nr:c2h2 transcription factor [Grosmannia clavigera kw1407]EFX03391.1 c2h2 transcription factor [Grosmannia clavigera kw1407]
MLSNPPSTNSSTGALQARKRLHRRQQSTPVAFEAMKMSNNLPNTASVAIVMQQQQQQQFQSAQMQQAPIPRQQPARQLGHRRGQSLDTRRQQLQQNVQRQQQMEHHIQRHQLFTMTTAADDSSSNSSNSNSNSNNFRQEFSNSTPYVKQSREEAFLLSPQGTPVMIPSNSQQFGGQGTARRQQQQQQDCTAAQLEYANGHTAVMMRRALSSDGMPIGQPGFELYSSPDTDGGFPSNTFMSFQDTASSAPMGVAASPQGWVSEDDTSSTRRGSRRISNTIMDRVVKFESLAVDGMGRPTTPPHQHETKYFPPTPTETSQESMSQQVDGARMARFSDDYDESMEETIKPVRNHGNRANRSSGVFDDMRHQAEAMANPTHPNMMQMPLTPADFMNMSNVNAEFMKIQTGNYAVIPVPSDMQHLSPPLSQQPTPASIQGVFDGNTIGSGIVSQGAFGNKTDMWPTDFDSNLTMQSFATGLSAEEQATMCRRPAHRRNESMASIVSAASIASINIDETRTETGVTLDDIATYIDGPNPVDGKWRCLYDNCNKRFGRKENIKSHVQTHLNDRQYQCPHCQKCFVRQHDLKRHAKIHTGVKPYPCECGNNFARHDALTRHRQRGMCIGAFDGAVRKIGKRGRPRKTRPSVDERRDKSSRTRSKHKSASDSSGGMLSSSPEMSSHSGYSDSSAVNSPRTDDSDNAFDDEPFEGMVDDAMLDIGFGLTTTTPHRTNSGTMNPNALTVSSAPMPGAGISAEEMVNLMPVVSPSEHAAALAASPSAMSHYSHMSHASMNSGEPRPKERDGEDRLLPTSHPASPAKSIASHYTQHPNTPPELSASSSPPHSSTHYFELDPNSSCAEEDSIGLSAPLTAGGCGPLGMDMGGFTAGPLDDDVMLMKAYTADDVLVQLDNSGLSMLNTSKFDDEYGMFTNNDDVFFGSS